MRSYEAARTLFSFLGFLSWIVIILGGLVAFSLGGITSSMGGFGGSANGMAVFAAAMPGLILAFLGFICLAIVQVGRASVDSAEYGQQMLQVARDHLQVSRQALQQGETLKHSFAALQAMNPDHKAAAAPETTNSSFAAAPEPKPSVPEITHKPGEVLDYRGKTIRVVEAGYVVGGTVFGSFEMAKASVDRHDALLPPRPEKHMSYADQLGVNTRSKPSDGNRSGA